MILQHTNYRSFLKDVLAERSRSNPSYSMRAMAKQLRVSPATLSGVLRGRKNLSPETALLVARSLDLNEKETEIFLLLVQIETTISDESRVSLLKRLHKLGASTETTNLSLDHFRIISDWYHFAIMSLTEVKSVKVAPNTMSAVAKSLGITKAEAERAVERLLNLEMIELVKGVYKKTKNYPTVVSVSPNAALRSYHKQTLQKSIESLETQTPQEKYIGSETMAFDSSQLKEFDRLTEEYFTKVLDLAKTSKNKDHVYHLGIQFFRLTTKDTK